MGLPWSRYACSTAAAGVLALAPATAQEARTRAQLPPLSHAAVAFDEARG